MLNYRCHLVNHSQAISEIVRLLFSFFHNTTLWIWVFFSEKWPKTKISREITCWNKSLVQTGFNLIKGSLVLGLVPAMILDSFTSVTNKQTQSQRFRPQMDVVKRSMDHMYFLRKSIWVLELADLAYKVNFQKLVSREILALKLIFSKKASKIYGRLYSNFVSFSENINFSR